MDEFIREAMLIIGSYIGILIVAYSILAWMMSGLLAPYLKVKTSRGRLILVKVKTITQDYYKPGKIDKGFLIYKDRQKDERRIGIPLDKVVIYRSMGVNVIDVDDEKNAINCIDYTAVSGFDAVKYNDLYLRALYKPSLFDKKEKYMMAILVIILIGVVVIGLLVFNLSDQVNQLGQVTAPAIVTGGV